VLFEYLDGAKDIKLPVVGVNCKFESCYDRDLTFTEAALHEIGTLGCRTKLAHYIRLQLDQKLSEQSW
jgi:hypothetical protein